MPGFFNTDNWISRKKRSGLRITFDHIQTPKRNNSEGKGFVNTEPFLILLAQDQRRAV